MSRRHGRLEDSDAAGLERYILYAISQIREA